MMLRIIFHFYAPNILKIYIFAFIKAKTIIPTMKTSYFFRILASLLLLSATFAVQGATNATDSVRVLWIGNSYTYFNDLPAMVKEIANTQGIPIANTEVLKGGERLKGHLANPRLTELLKKGGWDFVIVQENSSLPAYDTEFVRRETYPYAHAIDSLAHLGSPDVKVVFYMTWGHKHGNIRPREGYPLCDTYQGMQERLKTSYLEMTYQNNAICAPVGMAWAETRQQRPDIILYCQDLFHPAPAGTYLNAVTIFATMYPRHFQTDYTAGLTPADAEYLQQIGQDTVLDNMRLLNIDR